MRKKMKKSERKRKKERERDLIPFTFGLNRTTASQSSRSPSPSISSSSLSPLSSSKFPLYSFLFWEWGSLSLSTLSFFFFAILGRDYDHSSSSSSFHRKEGRKPVSPPLLPLKEKRGLSLFSLFLTMWGKTSTSGSRNVRVFSAGTKYPKGLLPLCLATRTEVHTRIRNGIDWQGWQHEHAE